MSFLDDIAKFAPTIGGVLGGIGGEVVDPFGGGIAGAALGSGLGKAVENESQGKGLGGVSDLESAVEGGIGQGAGDLLGGAAGAVGGLIGKSGADATDAATQAATDAVTSEKAASDAQEGIDTATANKANYGVHSPTAQTVNKLGSNQKFMENMGFDSNDPYEMEKVAKAGYTINNKVDNALQGVNISTKGITNPIMDLAKSGQLQSPEANSLWKAFNDSGAPFGPNGEMPKTMPATSIRQVTQSLGNEIGNKEVEIDNAIRNSADTVPLKAQKEQLSNIRDALTKTLNDSDEVNQNVKALTMSPEEQTALASQTNEKLAQEIADKVNGSDTYSDLIPEMQKYAQMGKLSSGSINDIENVTAGERAMLRAKLAGDTSKPVTTKTMAAKSASDHALDAVANGATGRKTDAIVSAFKAVSKAKNNAIPSGTIRSKVGGLLERMSPFTGKPLDDASPMLHPTILGKMNGGQGLNTGILNKVPGAMGTTVATSPNVAQGATMNPTTGITNMQQGQPTTGIASGQLSPYATIMQMMGTDPFLSSSLAPIANTLAPTVQKAQEVEAQLPALQQSFKAAGGAQGPLGGLLAKIGSAFGGGETAKYTAQQKEVMTLLQSLGISPSNVPSVTESPGAAQAGFSQIQSGLGGVLSGVPGQ